MTNIDNGSPYRHHKTMRETQRKGDIAVSQAVATLTREGFDVALPLTESAAYDLIVDTGKYIKRVQVRYTTNGDVDLRRVHSNSKGYVVKKTRLGAYDWLYVLHKSGKEYLIKECLVDRRSIKPTEKYLLKNMLINE